MLTDVQIRKAKPTDKPFRLTDGAGLHLFVTPAGGKLWRLRYEFGGKEKLLSLGPYPDVGLADARAARDEAKKILRAGRDPGVARKQRVADAPNTFEAIARQWFGLQRERWTETHAGDVINSLERDVFPTLGVSPIKDIGAPAVLSLLRGIEARDARETAHRIRQRMSAVFVFAIASGLAETDPAAIVQKALAPVRKGRQPAVTDLAKAREVLAAAEATPAHPTTQLALRLLAMTVVRPGTLIGTPWPEFDDLGDEDPLWQVPAARMKLRLAMKEDEARDHLVPLPRQAVETIEVLRRLTGRGRFVFPNSRSPMRPQSSNAIGYLLNRAGYHHRHVPHGWRATFSTVMNERYPADSRIIDLMLAHTPKDKIEGAYNRAAHLARRRELAQIWADLIMDGRPPPADLLRLPRR